MCSYEDERALRRVMLATHALPPVTLPPVTVVPTCIQDCCSCWIPVSTCMTSAVVRPGVLLMRHWKQDVNELKLDCSSVVDRVEGAIEARPSSSREEAATDLLANLQTRRRLVVQTRVVNLHGLGTPALARRGDGRVGDCLTGDEGDEALDFGDVKRGDWALEGHEGSGRGA